MIEGTRLYINLTNKCNVACPFCCMYSEPKKTSFLDFETFKSIIDNCKGDFELQLEGGEPLLHKDIFLFIEYAIHTNRCKKVMISSNGILLEKYLKRFVEIKSWYNVPFVIKVSINYYLLEKHKNHLEKMTQIVFATEYIDNFDIVFNVRKRFEDVNLEDQLKKYKLYDKSNIFFLQSYGKLSDSEYEKPVIVKNIDNWFIYASDGTCFEHDLIARSEHEKNL